MTKFLTRFYAILTVLVVLILQVNEVNAAQTEKIIKIGIYAPFTTQSAYIGRNMLGAMEIARDQLQSSEIHYEFYTLDKLSNNTQALNTLQKFIDAHHINVLITEGAETGALVAPLAQKNDLIHFCLGCEVKLADGKNNFHAHSPHHKRGAVLSTAMKPEFVAQFKQEYFSQPVTEAGYAYDIFHLLNNSAIIAMKTNPNFSSQAIANNLIALESGSGLMGSFRLKKKGIQYKTLTV